jgi:hypothetical protein
MTFQSNSIDQLLDQRASAELIGTQKEWVEYAWQYGIKPEVGVCIAVADTGLGKKTDFKYNYGNVGRWKYETPSEGIEAIYRTLSHKSGTLEDLSCYNGCKKGIYAESEYNWHKNVQTCLRGFYIYVPDNFNFKNHDIP